MDEITPVMESVVKVEVEFKEESEYQSSENEGSQNNKIEEGVSYFESWPTKSEEDEEIKPPVAVFIQSSYGNGDEDQGKESFEKNMRLASSMSLPVKGEGGQKEEEIGIEKEEDFSVADCNWRLEAMTSGCGVSSFGTPSAELRLLSKRKPTRQKKIRRAYGPYQCDICKRIFIRKQKLLNHMSTHSDERPYICDVCQMSFKLIQNLLRHKKIHTGDRPYHCEICKISFICKSSLLDHIRKHTNEKPYLCDVCQDSFRLKRALSDHVKLHSGETFQCDTCKRTFVRKSYLLVHTRTHTGEKPYQCDVCKKCYLQKVHLLGHMRTHTGDRPYQCDVCKKGFQRVTHLNRHKRTHTGDKPYQCDKCEKSFTRKYNLVRHEMKHTLPN